MEYCKVYVTRHAYYKECNQSNTKLQQRPFPIESPLSRQSTLLLFSSYVVTVSFTDRSAVILQIILSNLASSITNVMANHPIYNASWWSIGDFPLCVPFLLWCSSSESVIYLTSYYDGDARNHRVQDNIKENFHKLLTSRFHIFCNPCSKDDMFVVPGSIGKSGEMSKLFKNTTLSQGT